MRMINSDDIYTVSFDYQPGTEEGKGFGTAKVYRSKGMDFDVGLTAQPDGDSKFVLMERFKTFCGIVRNRDWFFIQNHDNTLDTIMRATADYTR